MGIPPPPDPRALLRQAGLAAKKSWGQSFLCDQRVLEAIADATRTDRDQPVVELGAGLGALTYYLVQRAGRVIAVERDRELVPLLRRELGWATQLEVREADAASVDYAALATELGCAPVVAGNLPYQIASRILVSLAGAHDHVGRAVLLVQREVAQRLAAVPGSRTYGLLSVLVQRAFMAELLRSVPPGAFHPPPKVVSAVVRLEPHGRAPAPAQDRLLVAAARAAFSARRKTLRNAVSGALGAEPARVEEAVLDAGLEPGARAETLAVEQFLRLGEALRSRGLLPEPLESDAAG